ncbi:hypothetical protein B9G69_012240 [Bdellovibrio sp. SKB1291214]|uniref:hypothetical protein n=1 Tax=Bdellovibrio sp. SKB1291214 TaxID=1732569 RepID=UPI000B51763C|nr:hypothetical protein [Bdellovibrio sp. SKB1291214]UYL07815.1 hypothetical protein B9G69_012240 [Bdellovibrio sp. SKB1291214]
MNLTSFTLIFSILCGEAFAFDRITCESTLGNWTVHNKLKSNDVVLSTKYPTTLLKRDDSLMLVVRDERGKDIAFVSPWNDIQFFKGKKVGKSKYKFDFKTDSETQFTLDITDFAEQTHSISCKLTF